MSSPCHRRIILPVKRNGRVTSSSSFSSPDPAPAPASAPTPAPSWRVIHRWRRQSVLFFLLFCWTEKGCAHTHTYRLIVIITILSQRKFSNSCTSVIHVQKRGFYSRSRGRHILLSAWLGGCTHTSTHRQWWGVCVRCEHASLVHAKSLICLRVYPIHTVTLHIHVDSNFCLCLSHHLDTEWQTVPIPWTVCGRTDH